MSTELGQGSCVGIFKNDLKDEKKVPLSHNTEFQPPHEKTYFSFMRTTSLICISAQSDQRFCYSLSVKNNSYA